MGGHDAAESWLDRWREQEPVRLYLWSVATAVLAGCVVAGWLTRELALAIAGPIAALLMVGGTAAARGQAFAPATVGRLEAQWAAREDEAVQQAADEQHAVSWEAGWEAGVLAAEKAAEETARTPDRVAAETRPHPAPPPQTAALTAQAPCGYVVHDAGGVRRCVLPRHPDTFGHQLGAVGAQE